MSAPSFKDIVAVLFDIDGTLTDGTTTWLGPEIGWTQTYSTRDGEAILLMKRKGLTVLPLSRNKTMAARVRMEALGLSTECLGVPDKRAAVVEFSARRGIALGQILFVGDGIEDADVFEAVGLGCAVNDAHPHARAHARIVLESSGGGRVMEELSLHLTQERAAEERRESR